MSDSPENILVGAGPVQAAVARLCIQCAEIFLSTEARALCDQECAAAYDTKTGLGHVPRTERLHVEKFLEMGEFVAHEGRFLVLTGVLTRGPGGTVGDFVAAVELPAESSLRQ